MPAFRAALTLEKTYREIPFDLVDEVILVDDHSPDNTLEVAKSLGIKHLFHHDVNKGFVEIKKRVMEKHWNWALILSLWFILITNILLFGCQQ